MRIRIPLGRCAGFDPVGLRHESAFLYRRIGDQGRQVLGVGILASSAMPEFSASGRVKDWVFGHLSYELMTELHGLVSTHPRTGDLPSSEWIVPRWVIEWQVDEAFVHCMPGDEAAAREMADRVTRRPDEPAEIAALEWKCLTEQTVYLAHVGHLMKSIQRGDIYEVNYCIEREAWSTAFDPFIAFTRLLRATDAPFAAFHRRGDRYALCMSPERFLAFDGTRVAGEPMKGTRPRGHDDASDGQLRHELATDPKERSENIMALDVMRHDLSRVAAPRSVKVEELCAVRSLPRVHQMVSRVAARLADGRTPGDAIRSSFPPASMTGAPKRSAMHLIDATERASRDLYSGSLGFFAPDGTGDLNVVIRTVLFDARSGRLSLTTGSALTAQCDPAAEWQECELKAMSIINALCHA